METKREKKICIKKDAILENISTIERLLQQNGCELVISTKSLKLNRELLGLLDKKFRIYDIKRSNLELLHKNGYRVICTNLFEKSASVIVNRIDALRELVGKHCESLYLFFEFGDNREGLVEREFSSIIELLPTVKYSELVIASNIGCLSEQEAPDEAYLSQFIKIRKLFEQNGFHINKFSIGGSNCISILNKLRDDFKSVKLELRVGEAIFFGAYNDVPISSTSLYRENIFFEVNLLRSFPDNTGLYDFGYSDIELGDVKLKEDIFSRQSANHTLIRFSGRGALENNLLLNLTYRGLSKMSEQEGVRIYAI